MKSILIWAISILFVLVSCKKEKFPDTDDLQGSWTEQTSNSFKHKLIFDSETMLFFKQSSIDTLSYRLDKKTDLIYLTAQDISLIGESRHKIFYNRKNKTLTIFGLFATTGNETETEFKKE